jgi:hypothetical protein
MALDAEATSWVKVIGAYIDNIRRRFETMARRSPWALMKSNGGNAVPASHALDFLRWGMQHFALFWLPSWSRYGEIEKVQRAFRLAGGYGFAPRPRPSSRRSRRCRGKRSDERWSI